MPTAIHPKKISSVSAVFPAFNDAGTIPSMVISALIALRQTTDDYEIIVTNDGSSDHTHVVLKEMAERYPELRVIDHPYNQGYGGALLTGFSAATKEWIFLYGWGCAIQSAGLIQVNYGSVRWSGCCQWVQDFAQRSLDSKDHWSHVPLFCQYIIWHSFKDVDCDFRLIRKKALAEIDLESVSGAICVENGQEITGSWLCFC